MFTRLTPTLRALPRLPQRALSTSLPRFSGNHPLSPEPTQSPDSPSTTQGHASDKKVQKDVQSQYVQQGKDARKEGGKSASGEGEAQPFDAARMDGGEAKSAEGTGPFKDQVGGQEGGAHGGGTMGGSVEASGESTGAKVQKALGMKPSRKFHTSARSLAPAPGGSGNTIPGARDPKESSKDMHGDQNPHLTHQSTGKDHAERKGNAAETPSLPSKNKKPDGAKGFHTSATAGADAKYAGVQEGEAKKAGYAVPPEALPQGLSSAYSASEATPPPPAGATPSSEVQFSSTAQDPPNDVLREAVKKGEMSERNPHPSGETGKQGLKEGWKNRKA